MLLVEPFFTGSHAEWAKGYSAESSHAVTLETMPGRFWKWRMHGAAITMAKRMHRLRLEVQVPDIFLATDMLDVAAWRGLLPSAMRAIPVVTYFHENQFAYPEPSPQSDWSASRRRRANRPDAHYGFTNITTGLASDAVWFNSAFNRSAFFQGAQGLLRSMPDCREASTLKAVRDKSHVVPLGMQLRDLSRVDPAPKSDVPRIVWNHRWEHDKDPGSFVDLLERLAESGVAFDVVVLGESAEQAPPHLERLVTGLPDRIAHVGYAPSRREYAAWLRSGDVVISTAQQEFFGSAVVEAIACGCRPILPDRLAYPELFPANLRDRVLYQSEDDLFNRTRLALETADELLTAALAEHVMRFDWSVQAPHYDSALLALARSHGPRRATGGLML